MARKERIDHYISARLPFRPVALAFPRVSRWSVPKRIGPAGPGGGSAHRAADAAGADAVVLTGRAVDLYNPKVVRSTTGSLFHVPIAVDVQLDAAVDRAREAGLRVLAADVSGRDLQEARSAGSLDGPTAWVFGNEARGLDAEKLELADEAVRVPIFGRAESMNLATAASVLLYESAFAQRQGRAD